MKANLALSFSILSLAASNAAVVQFDLNTGSSPTQAGWTAAPLGAGSGSGVSLTTSAIGAVTVDSRDRAGTGIDAGGGAEAAMWNDFVFANGSFNSASGSGLRLSLSGLAANTTYPITFWAFDDGSNPQPAGIDRASDWSGGGGSGRLTFPGDPDPATLSDYSLTFNATTDGTGALTLDGIVSATDPSTSHNVFLNGLEVGDAVVPEPSGAMLSLIGFFGMALRRRR